ncbi:hypothetical protein X798_07891 [Onchocerca flexuosa]|uniref:Uncharacterized protein n=2 Tax=Onchocerca flexuosa TaxID=387005 RepID=A0A183I007_9BILA|nr:hypothetical protein X798_07891 [Onchocerca flexuosa]VDP12859.1 unnamed protein product [Onchocerca flexuosa]
MESEKTTPIPSAPRFTVDDSPHHRHLHRVVDIFEMIRSGIIYTRDLYTHLIIPHGLPSTIVLYRHHYVTSHSVIIGSSFRPCPRPGEQFLAVSSGGEAHYCAMISSTL